MIYQEKKITLKDGRNAILRAPEVSDAEKVMEMFIGCCGETDFLVNNAEQARAKMTLEGEEKFIESSRERDNVYFILCTVDGEFAGNSELRKSSPEKHAHRGEVAISVRQKFWGMGIGSKLFDEMISIAKNWGISQLELQVYDENERAIALYKSKGFVECGCIPDAAHLPDGRKMGLVTMILKL